LRIRIATIEHCWHRSKQAKWRRSPALNTMAQRLLLEEANFSWTPQG